MIPEELMQKVRQLQIYTSRAVNEDFAGEYSSAFKGRGMEFAEVREYQPGDDVRTIDWNVTARTGTPYVKSFIEERELTVMLAVDLSASGRFGSIDRVKNETAAELCAILAFTAIRNNDKVGLLIFTDDIELFIPPKKGARHVLRLIRELLNFEPARRGTNIASALQHLNRVLKRRAVVFVVSDFLVDPMSEPARTNGDGGNTSNGSRFVAPRNLAAIDSPIASLETPLRLLARRHDVIVVSIADPREYTLPAVGLIELEDAETGERMVIDTSSRTLRRRFENHVRRTNDRLRMDLRRMGIDHVNVATHKPYLQTLVELFRRRERGRRA